MFSHPLIRRPRVFKIAVAAILIVSFVFASVSALAAPQPITDVAKQAAKVAGYKEVVALAKAKPADYDALMAAYQQKLQATVKSRDAEFGEQLDVALTAAIAAGKSGELPQAVAAQMVDKLLQKVFALTIKHEFLEAKKKVAADRQGALHNIDEAIAYFEAVRGTVQKRDKAFSTTIEAEIDTALAEAQKAAQNGDEEGLYFWQPIVTHNLIRAFYLAVVGYGEKIEQGAAAGNDEREHMAEAWSFYQAFKSNVGKKSADLASFVEARFNPVSGNPNLVKASEIRAALTAGLAGYVVHEVAASFEKWDKADRLHAAAEGGAIAQAIEIHLGEKLGAEAKARFKTAITDFVAAVRAKDRAKADAAGQVLTSLCQELIAKLNDAPADKIVLKIGEGRIKAKGKWIAADVPPFIENSRTLVPVRFVAEALGAQVDWLADTFTVKISFKGKVLLLPIGQTTVTVDGTAKTVDVPAFIRQSRTYVPVRFVTEFLGGQVEWDEASQTVTLTN